MASNINFLIPINDRDFQFLDIPDDQIGFFDIVDPGAETEMMYVITLNSLFEGRSYVASRGYWRYYSYCMMIGLPSLHIDVHTKL